MRDDLVLIGLVLLPGCAALPVAILAVGLAFMPRRYTRLLRHHLAKFIVWQWVKGSKISSRVHTWLWQEGNGDG